MTSICFGKAILAAFAELAELEQSEACPPPTSTELQLLELSLISPFSLRQSSKLQYPHRTRFW